MIKILNVVKNRSFISNFLIILGMALSIPIVYEMDFVINADELTKENIPLALLSVLFVCIIACFVIFVFLEKGDSLKNISPFVIVAFLVVLTATAIPIFIQEDETHHIIYPTNGLIGNQIDVASNISINTKLLTFYNEMLMYISIFLCFFVFPKKYKSVVPVIAICSAFYVFLFGTMIYSLIAEFNSYINIFRFFAGEINAYQLEQYAPTAIYTHRNAFGLFLVLAIFSSLFCYEATKKKHFIIIPFICFCFLPFTVCKTGIILGSIFFIVYICYKELSLLKTNEKKKGLILFFVTISVLMTLLLSIIILIVCNEPFRIKISSLFRNGKTIKSRINIWKISIMIVSPTWWLCGKGYWLFDIFLKDCNWAVQYDNTGSPHNFIIGLLSRGGIPLLLSFILLFMFGFKYIIKIIKTKKDIAITILIGLSLFVIYGMLEDYYHVILAWLCLGLFVYNQQAKRENAFL